jgi:hypothetical protein
VRSSEWSVGPRLTPLLCPADNAGEVQTGLLAVPSAPHIGGEVVQSNMRAGDKHDAEDRTLQAVRNIFGGACLLLLGLGLWWAWLGALATLPIVFLPLAVAGTALAGFIGGWAIRSSCALIVPLVGIGLQAYVCLLWIGLEGAQPSAVEWVFAVPFIAAPWGILALAAWAGWHTGGRRPRDADE